MLLRPGFEALVHESHMSNNRVVLSNKTASEKRVLIPKRLEVTRAKSFMLPEADSQLPGEDDDVRAQANPTTPRFPGIFA